MSALRATGCSEDSVCPKRRADIPVRSLIRAKRRLMQILPPAQTAPVFRASRGIQFLSPNHTESLPFYPKNRYTIRMHRFRNILGFILLAALVPTQAFAHHAEWMFGHPLLQGLSMPIHGLDHLLVALAVGLLAVQLGGRALWAVPAAFSVLMLGGGLLNVAGVATPLLEQCILASAVVLGALLTARPQLPLVASVAIVALGAVFHGEALLTEKPADWSYAWFVFGCLTSAALVQAVGVALGLALQRFAPKTALRYAGAAVLVGAAVIYLFPAANGVVIHFLE